MEILVKQSLLFKDIWKELRQSEFRHWPLCYTWIGYHRSMVRLELYCLKSVDHNYCAVIVRVVDSWTFIICLAPHRYPRKDIYSFLAIPASHMDAWVKDKAAVRGAQHPWHRYPCAISCAEKWAIYAMFPVIMPQIKHDSSLATAVVAMLRLERSMIL